MRWPVFAAFAFLTLGLELSLRNVLVLRSVGNVAPSFVAVLAVFVAFFAPRTGVVWACWILGLLLDLCTDLPHGPDRAGPLLGAHALGFAFGGYVVVQIRPMLFRGRALTLAVMTVVFVIAAELVVVFIYAVHGWYPGEQLGWADTTIGGEMLRRLGIAAYSGVLAFLMAPVLRWSIPLWSFRAGPQRR